MQDNTFIEIHVDPYLYFLFLLVKMDLKIVNFIYLLDILFKI